MTEREVAEAVRDWARELLPDLVAGYAFLTAQKGELPDVAVEVAEKRIELGDPTLFPHSAIQQVQLRVFDVSMLLMVEKNTGQAADEQETQQLQAFGAAIDDAVRDDTTLGDRVPLTSPFLRIDYRLPFVRWPDSTRGRQMEVNLVVGELI